MGAWPDLYVPAAPTITPWSMLESIGAGLAKVTQTYDAAASAAWPSANLAIYVPILLTQRVSLTQFFTVNGTVAGDNVDLGLYASGAAGPAALIVSKGSTAQTGVSALQAFDVTDTTVGPGVFYVAIACNGTTGTLFRTATSTPLLGCLGVYQQAAAFPLPATATAASASQAYLPMFGVLNNRSVV